MAFTIAPTTPARQRRRVQPPGLFWLSCAARMARRLAAGANLGARVAPADQAQAIGYLVPNVLRHRRRFARPIPLRRVDLPRRCEMVERDVFRVAAARPETARAEDAGDAGEGRDVL